MNWFWVLLLVIFAPTPPLWVFLVLLWVFHALKQIANALAGKE